MPANSASRMVARTFARSTDRAHIVAPGETPRRNAARLLRTELLARPESHTDTGGDRRSDVGDQQCDRDGERDREDRGDGHVDDAEPTRDGGPRELPEQESRRNPDDDTEQCH